MMRFALILLAVAVAAVMAEKPVYPGNSAPAAPQTGGSSSGAGGPSPTNNERWDENGGGKWRTLYYGDTTAIIGNGSSGKKSGLRGILS